MNEPVRGPAHAAPEDRAAGASRRSVLLGGAFVLAAAGGGAAVGALRPAASPDKPTGRPPVELVAALTAENVLIAAIDATTGGSPAVRVALRQVRADHLAHRTALQAAVDAYPEPAVSTSPSGTGPVAALTVSGLRSAEQQAAARAGTRAGRLSGREAALLASIAASEATHAVLFG
ncbi:MAG: hypothetical protein DLM58_24665 [Pseudonocardiales bacterium]|nr:MAG: hypothetical protein DLM58_24665 [Pseudonocardiales bacterium]